VAALLWPAGRLFYWRLIEFCSLSISISHYVRFVN